MFIDPTEKDLQVRHVNGLSPLEKAMVRAYLQGCVYSWCKNNQSQDGAEEPKWFKSQYFLGEDNYYWQGTPLFCLYAKRLRQYDGIAKRQQNKRHVMLGICSKLSFLKTNDTFVPRPMNEATVDTNGMAMMMPTPLISHHNTILTLAEPKCSWKEI